MSYKINFLIVFVIKYGFLLWFLYYSYVFYFFFLTHIFSFVKIEKLKF